MTEPDRSKLTQQFLQCIAQHLSSRPECKGISYRIAIGVYDSILYPQEVSMFEKELSNKRVLFHPNIYVYPDRHHRKDTDKVGVVYHVASSHFENMILTYQEDGCTYVDTDKLVCGVYEYQPSVDNKKRRWVRIESL